MRGGTPYYAGLSKTELEKAIQDLLSSFGMSEEFESELISGLVEAKHYYCSKKGLRPSAFRKSPRKGSGYDFEGFFHGRGWHKVSWTQCLRPREDLDWLKRALRDAIQPRVIGPYKRVHPYCEICNVAPTEEVDHVDPEFDVLASAAIGCMSVDEYNRAFERFDWWSAEPFSLEPSNSAVVAILRAHETATLCAVCHSCHLRCAQERRTK